MKYVLLFVLLSLTNSNILAFNDILINEQNIWPKISEILCFDIRAHTKVVPISLQSFLEFASLKMIWLIFLISGDHSIR